ncbi:MAG: ribosome hibernation-promoting factor, HPF/YfiA family [Acidimicrobiales bacterium]
MELSVHTRNVQVGQDFEAAVRSKMDRVVRRLDGMDRAEVSLSRERNPRAVDGDTCELTLSGHRLIVRAKATGAGPAAAFENAAARLEHRLEKLKGRLVDRSQKRGPAGATVAGSTGALDGHLPGDLTSDGLATGEDDAASMAARIVRSKSFELEAMDADEAVLRMELLGHSFYLFTNVETGRSSVVYLRDDGQIGLIDAK